MSDDLPDPLTVTGYSAITFDKIETTVTFSEAAIIAAMGRLELRSYEQQQVMNMLIKELGITRTKKHHVRIEFDVDWPVYQELTFQDIANYMCVDGLTHYIHDNAVVTETNERDRS